MGEPFISEKQFFAQKWYKTACEANVSGRNQIFSSQPDRPESNTSCINASAILAIVHFSGFLGPPLIGKRSSYS